MKRLGHKRGTAQSTLYLTSPARLSTSLYVIYIYNVSYLIGLHRFNQKSSDSIEYNHALRMLVKIQVNNCIINYKKKIKIIDFQEAVSNFMIHSLWFVIHQSKIADVLHGFELISFESQELQAMIHESHIMNHAIHHS